MKTRFNLYLSKAEAESLEKMASAHSVSVPELIRIALRNLGEFPSERVKKPRGTPMADGFDPRRGERNPKGICGGEWTE